MANTVRKNPETHSPFTVTLYCVVSWEGFCVLPSIASAELCDAYNHFTRKLLSRENTGQEIAVLPVLSLGAPR